MGNSSGKNSPSILRQDDILQILFSINLPLIHDLINIVGSYLDQWDLPYIYFLLFPFSHEEIDQKQWKEYQSKKSSRKEDQIKKISNNNPSKNEKQLEKKRSLIKQRKIDAHIGKIYDARISNISTRMITVAGDGCCKIWDLLNGVCLFRQPCSTNWLMTCDNYWINTDYSLASSGGLDNIVTIYPISLRSFTSSSSLLNIKDKIELSGHDGYVGCARFTNEGQSIVSGSGDQTVRLWDIENKKEIWKNEESGGDVLVVAPITNETYLAAGVDKKIHFLDSRQKSTNLQVFGSHVSDINALSLSADQTQFASASDDGTCRLWDIRTGP